MIDEKTGEAAAMAPRVQFKLSYSEVEDRILFSGTFADGQEMNLWFTRRLTLGFLDLAGRISAATSGPGAADPSVKKEIAAFQKDAAVQAADKSTPYDAGTPHQELGAAPLLVNRVTVTPQRTGEGEDRVSLVFGLIDQRQISFPIGRDAFLTIWDMIDELVRVKTGWLTLPERHAADEASAKAVLH